MERSKLKRVLVVGDEPRHDKGTTVPFDQAGSRGKLERWLKLMGIEHYTLTNQSDSGFETKALSHRGPIIALGEKASKRLTRLGRPHYRMPHPSGRNRLLNDTEYEAFMIADCAKWLRGEITEPTQYSKEVNVRGGGSWK
jgi:hypothetical protein